MNILKSITPIILCGGVGTRLWPLSRESCPKQFIPLLNGKSLLQLTVERCLKFGKSLFVANEMHRYLLPDIANIEELIKGDEFDVVLEPFSKNTAPAIASVLSINKFDDEAILLILPADHYISDQAKFEDAVVGGVELAKNGHIVLFGVAPSFPSTAYGYISVATSLSTNSNLTNSFLVENFLEKPDIETAKNIISSGSCYWNSGIFLAKAGVLRKAFIENASDVYRTCNEATFHATLDRRYITLDKNIYAKCKSISFDHAVLERHSKLALIPLDADWCDLGSWNTIATLLNPDESGNRIHGNGIAFQSTGTYIHASNRPVVTLGTANLVVVDTSDAILIASTDKVEDVKNVVTELQMKGFKEATQPSKVERPWGSYDLLDSGKNFQVKRITVKPKGRLSLQLHRFRAEHWVVVKGIAKVTNGDRVFMLGENESTYIPIGIKHRLENPGNSELEMIEVQSGSYLGEDDIVRFDDVYGRS